MARVLFRLGVFSARHRLAVFVAWALVLVVAGVGAATGLKFSDSGFSLSGTESGRALEVLHAKFPATADDEGTGTLQLVLTARDGSPITSPENRALVSEALTAAATIAHVDAVSDPFDAARPYVSKDGTTAVSTLTFSGLTDDNTEAVYGDVLDAAGQIRGEQLDAEVGGTIVPEGADQSITEAIGPLVAFVILFLTFGSLVAAGANMLGALLGVAVGVLGVFAFSAVHPIGTTTPTLALMIGLAVGIDYCLFILARFRSELRDGRPVEAAIGRAVGTAGSAVVFAGVTVIIALVGLSVVRISFITEMGLAAAVTVLCAVLMSLTLLPALMRSMGRRVLPRRERRGAHARRPVDEAVRLSFLERWIRLIVKRPVTVGGLAIVALLLLSVPTLSLNTALSTPGGDDPASTERVAYDRIADKFGAGSQGPLIVLVEGRGVSDHLPAVTTLLTGLRDVTAVTAAGVDEGDDTAIVQVTPAGGPIDESTEQLVHRIRDAAREVSGVTLSVTGSTAVDIDTNEKLSRALIVYLVLVVGLSLALLVLLFRSLLVPLLATAGFLLSLGTGLGVTVAVYQWGWLDAVFPAPQGNPILSLLPILIVGILFGLAMDYQVFLVSRMHEAHRRGLSPVEAVVDGFGRTAVVVVAAAAIMTSVFAGFGLSASPFAGAIGLALTAGVLADAFVVRMIVVPALLTLFGEAAWWMPRSLDRVLPHVDAEGEALEQQAEAPREPQNAMS